MKNLSEKICRLAALVLLSVLIPGTQSCSQTRPSPDRLESGSRGGDSDYKFVKTSVFSDQEMERFLLNARVITPMPMAITSTTFPMALELRWEGKVRKAIFKYGHVESNGVAPVPLDSYRHEVAAYRLDRVLDLKMVPVAVIRTVGTEGALMEWVSNALPEPQLRKTSKHPSEPQRLIRQQAVMRLFDALILNPYRTGDDQLITPDDWKLHLIDHSRAFGTSSELSESFISQRADLSRSLLRKLEKLDKQSLKILFDGLLNDAQIEAILLRRGKILKKISADREQYGDATVFHE